MEVFHYPFIECHVILSSIIILSIVFVSIIFFSFGERSFVHPFIRIFLHVYKGKLKEF